MVWFSVWTYHYSEIAITLDNWEEYFIIENVEKWNTNSFGEIDDLRFDVVFYIKPEYSNRVADKENAKINYDISYDSICKTIETDYASQTYTFTNYWTERETFQNIGTWNCAWLTSEQSVIGTRLGYGKVNDIPTMGYYENVTVNRIQGILCLYDEWHHREPQGSLFLY